MMWPGSPFSAAAVAGAVQEEEEEEDEEEEDGGRGAEAVEGGEQHKSENLGAKTVGGCRVEEGGGAAGGRTRRLQSLEGHVDDTLRDAMQRKRQDQPRKFIRTPPLGQMRKSLPASATSVVPAAIAAETASDVMTPRSHPVAGGIVADDATPPPGQMVRKVLIASASVACSVPVATMTPRSRPAAGGIVADDPTP